MNKIKIDGKNTALELAQRILKRPLTPNALAEILTKIHKQGCTVEAKFIQKLFSNLKWDYPDKKKTVEIRTI